MRAASRAVHIQHVLLSLKPGGLENGVTNIVSKLDPVRFRSSVCCLDEAGAFGARVPPAVPIRAMGRRGGIDLGLLWRLVRAFRATQTDIVHTRNAEAFLYGCLAAHLAGVPGVVHSEHGRVFPERPHRRWAQRHLSRLADAILAVSDDLRRRLVVDLGIPAEAVSVIYNGVDCDLFRPAHRETARQRLGTPASPTVVGSVGRLVPVKNFASLLRAVRLLSPELQPEVWFVGDGPDRTHLEMLARALLPAGRVRFLGHREDLPSVLPAFDVFAVPSLSEGISNTLLEAMACGLPVVATDVGGNPEVVEHGRTGLLFAANHDAALARHLAALCSDPGRRIALGANATQEIRRRFSLETMVSSYESVYRAVADRKGRFRPRTAAG